MSAAAAGDPMLENTFARWTYGHYFKFVRDKDIRNIIVNCTLCAMPKELSTSRSSTSNLSKHLERFHSYVKLAKRKHAEDESRDKSKQAKLTLSRSGMQIQPQEVRGHVAEHVVEDLLPPSTVDSTSNDDQLHVSIQKGLVLPPLRKCKSCCPPGHYHCPFCSTDYFKPTTLTRVRHHLADHLRRALYVGEYTIHRCGLICRKQEHYHCLYCTATAVMRIDILGHLSSCPNAPQLKAQHSEDGKTRGLSDPSLTPEEIPSYNMDSGDDSDIFGMVPEWDSSQGASSSQLVSPVVPEPSQCVTVGPRHRTTAPDSSKCHQSVQTNIEKPQDCDEFYFMNLVKMFKKLPFKKKADVRMKIERLLFEAEFE